MHRGFRKASDRTCSCCPAILPDDQRVLCDRCLHEARVMIARMLGPAAEPPGILQGKLQ
jgi:uncharacterized paraquat-inducible protein A